MLRIPDNRHSRTGPDETAWDETGRDETGCRRDGPAWLKARVCLKAPV